MTPESRTATDAVDVGLDTLRHLLTAAHLIGCASWAEAAGKAEQDVRPWLVREPAGKGRIEVIPAVLAQLAEAAQAAMDACGTRDGHSAWAALVTADLLQVEPLCRAGISHAGAHDSRSRNDT